MTTDLQGISSSIEALAWPDGVTVAPWPAWLPERPWERDPRSPTPPLPIYYVVVWKGTTAASLVTLIADATSGGSRGRRIRSAASPAADDSNASFNGYLRERRHGDRWCRRIHHPERVHPLREVLRDVSDLPLNQGEVSVWAPPNPSRFPVIVNVLYPS